MSEHKTENSIQEMFPYLIVRNAPSAIDFYKRVFGAEEMFRLAEPGGRIGHVQLKLGTAIIMLADEHPEHGILSPLATGGTGSMLHLHVSDVDAMLKLAVNAGAKVISEPKNQFYRERSCKFLDPFGHTWMLGQHIEDVSTEEMQRRYNQLLSQ